MYVYAHAITGFQTGFFGGSGEKKLCVEPRALGVCGGMLPQEIFFKCICSEFDFWDPKKAGLINY